MASMPERLPDIRPISDLRTKLNDVCDQARDTQEPIYFTKNGAASLVVFDAQAYDRKLQHERLARKVFEAEIESRYNPSFHDSKAVESELDEILAHWGE